MDSRRASETHARWIESLRSAHGRTTPPKIDGDEDSSLYQCLNCRYYVPLSGLLGRDWGVCSNSRSTHDRETVFEHFGCVSYNDYDRCNDRA